MLRSPAERTSRTTSGSRPTGWEVLLRTICQTFKIKINISCQLCRAASWLYWSDQKVHWFPGHFSEPFLLKVRYRTREFHWPILQTRHDAHAYRCVDSRLKAITKVTETAIGDFLYADNCALNACRESTIQHQMNKFTVASGHFSLTFSTKKAKTMYQPASEKLYVDPYIMVNDQSLQAVQSLAYLGSILSNTSTIDLEISNRISKACTAFGRLKSSVWERRGIRPSTKLKVYKAIVLTTLLYACDTLTLYRRHERRMNHLHLSCLRSKLLKIQWQDRIPHTAVLRRANTLRFTLIAHKVQWDG